MEKDGLFYFLLPFSVYFRVIVSAVRITRDIYLPDQVLSRESVPNRQHHIPSTSLSVVCRSCGRPVC